MIDYAFKNARLVETNLIYLSYLMYTNLELHS